MNTLIRGACTALFLAIAGCGGGGGGAPIAAPVNQPGAPSAPPAPPVRGIDCGTLGFDKTTDKTAPPGGIWRRWTFNCANNTFHDISLAIVTEDGRFRIIGADEHVLRGDLWMDGDTFDGFGVDFAPTGVEYFSGPTTSMFVAGNVRERELLEGRWGTEWGDYGYFGFDYKPSIYERATPLADLAGTWPTDRAGGPAPGVWTIESDGRFEGQDDQGCLYAGQFYIIDDRFSVLDIDLSVTDCGLAGFYTGLAYYEKLVDWWDKGINVYVDDGQRALRIVMAL